MKQLENETVRKPFEHLGKNTKLFKIQVSFNLTKRDSFPNIQVTENSDISNSPISHLGNKLKLNKL